MNRLAELTRTAKMSRWTIATALSLAAIVSFSPLVELVPAAPPTEITAGDFVAKFSNGVTVELIGLADNDSENQKWWKPDGTPLEKTPNIQVSADLAQGPGQIGRKICWQWKGIGGKDVQTRWMTKPHYHHAGGGQGWDEQGNPSLKVWAVGLPDQKTFTMKLSMSVPETTWKTQVTSQAGYTSSTGRRLPNGENVSLMYTQARADDEDTVVSMSYKTSGEVRLAALDIEGQTHVGKFESSSGTGGFVLAEVRFQNIKPQQLKTWQFQTRQRKSETVEFRNVSLHRGKVTYVETVMLEPQDPQAADPPQTNKTSHLEYGQVIERTVNDDSIKLGNYMIDFDTGEVFSPPEKSPRKKPLDWIKDKGIDAMGDLRKGYFEGLIGIDFIAIPTSAKNWTPDAKTLKEIDAAAPSTPAMMSGQQQENEQPATYLFKTREGNRGVLQILEITKDRAVKIRYKLLDLAAKSPPKEKPAVTKATKAEDKEAERERKYLKKHHEFVRQLAGEHGYRLEADQLMKHIGKPFPEIRTEFRRLQQDHHSWSEHPEKEPLQPTIDFYYWTAEKGTRWAAGTYQQGTLASVFDAVLSLELYQIECDPALLNTEFAGDWILPWRYSPQKVRIPTQQDVAALEEILNEKLPQKLSLEWKQVEQTVLVATGNYKFSPIPGPNGKLQVIDGEMADRAHGYFHFPIRRNPVRSISTGHYPKFLQTIGEVLGLPVVNETEKQPGERITLFWVFPDDDDRYVPGTQPLGQEDEQEVLATISQQTGLQFTKAVRPAYKLFVEAQP